MKTPPMTEVRVSYSYGVKMNLGKNTYESADAHISRSETFDVTGMSDEEVAEFVEQRYALLKEDIDGKIEEEYSNTSCFGRG